MRCAKPMFYDRTSRVHLAGRLACVLALLVLPACGVVKQWFPDKEKEYQHTTEIPSLVLPPDLKNPQVFTLPAMPAAMPEPPVSPTLPSTGALSEGLGAKDREPSQSPGWPDNADTASEAAAVDRTDPETGQAENQPVPYPVEAMQGQEQSGLRIKAPLPNAWRAVEMALGKNAIEVSERDDAARQLTVYYDPDERTIEDNGFWDKVDFLFYGLKGKEKIYVLKMTDNAPWSDLKVFDTENQPAADEGADKLIAVIKQAIESDFSK